MGRDGTLPVLYAHFFAPRSSHPRQTTSERENEREGERRQVSRVATPFTFTARQNIARIPIRNHEGEDGAARSVLLDVVCTCCAPFRLNATDGEFIIIPAGVAPGRARRVSHIARDLASDGCCR